MIIGSHLLIAEYLYDYLVEETGVKLNLRKFRFGNIKPDIKSQAYQVEHTFESSFEMVKGIHDSILQPQTSLKELSLQLGVISHFVSDYFCFYHYDAVKFKESISNHLKYEYALHKIIKKTLKNNELSFPEDDDLSFRDVILKFRQLYQENSKDLLMDIVFALSTTRVILKKLVCQYAEQEANQIVYANYHQREEQVA